MVQTRTPSSKTISAPRSGERRRGITLGAVAGTLGLGCCVYPVVLVLVGASSATAAVDLGNTLYDDWGWAFKGAAVVFAGTAVWIQRRRAAQCPVDQRPDLKRMAAWLAGTGIATYGLLYAGTKGLERLA